MNTEGRTEAGIHPGGKKATNATIKKGYLTDDICLVDRANGTEMNINITNTGSFQLIPVPSFQSDTYVLWEVLAVGTGVHNSSFWFTDYLDFDFGSVKLTKNGFIV